MAQPAWQPGSDLRHWLIYGVRGALIAGLFTIAAASLVLAKGPVAGFGLSDALDLAAMIPFALVIVAYWKVSLAANAPSLRKSALGLYGLWVLREMVHQGASEGDPPWLVLLLLTVASLAAIALTVFVWNLERIEKGNAKSVAPPALPAAAEKVAEPGSDPPSGPATNSEGPPEVKLRPTAPGTNTAKGTAAGGCALALVLFAKTLANLPLLGGNFLPVVFIVLLIVLVSLAVFFPVWFAIAKLRLGATLGGALVLVGAMELALFLGMIAVEGEMQFEQYQAAERAGPNAEDRRKAEKRVEDAWRPSIAAGSILGWGVWSGLTAALFLKVRSLCPAPNAAEDAIVPIVR
jgi:hypothetical protein